MPSSASLGEIGPRAIFGAHFAQRLHAENFLVELDGCFLIEHVGAAVNELRFHALSPCKSNGCLSHFM